MISVSDARLTFIWFESSLSLLSDPAPDVPHAFRGRKGSYSSTFRDVRVGGGVATGYSYPWPKQGIHRFWKYYLGGVLPPDLKGVEAWNLFIPLRIQLPFDLKTSGVPGTVTAEGYLYPHGHALMVTTRLVPTSPVPLTEAITLARAVRHEKFLSDAAGLIDASTFNLDHLADAGLRWLHTTGLGDHAERGSISPEPYSVVTFVRTQGVDVGEPVSANSEIHRAVEATTAWRATWAADKLPPVEVARADIESRAPAGHLMYVTRRGRSVWFPEVPDSNASERHSLSCYHRNQVFSALQVESLGGLVRSLNDQIDAGIKLTQSQEDCARHAAGLLGRLLGGHLSTYKSGSIKAHIVRNDLVAPTNTLRARYAMPPLVVP